MDEHGRRGVVFGPAPADVHAEGPGDARRIFIVRSSRAFVTSASVNGNLGGIAGADTMCRSLAAAAHLYRPESYKALIASTVAGNNAVDRFVFDGPWYRRDGLLFAHNKRS